MTASLARLPSLDLLRGFVTVGRRMSVTLAAEDLCLTQSAVSRQIRTLEDLLGVKLFARGHRSIHFTAEGERLFRAANVAVQELQEAVDALRVNAVRPPVTITCTIGIAGLWLLPRLSDFQRDHPGIDVRSAASDKLEDLRGEGIDLAIRYCTREIAGEGGADVAERLFGETVVPVASPALGLDALAAPQDLADQSLLEFEGSRFPWLRWREWLAVQGFSAARPKSMLRFNQYDQAIAAACAGQGLALGRLPLIQPLIDQGRLKILRAPRAGPETSYAYWLVRARAKPRAEALAAARWIVEQAARLDLVEKG